MELGLNFSAIRSARYPRRYCGTIQRTVLYLVFLIVLPRAFAQAPAGSGGHEPKTSPQTMQILSSYEGQTVNSIELAGRPDLDTPRYAASLVQRAGEPFSKQKIDRDDRRSQTRREI